MSTYDKIAWLPLCGGLTGLGLVLSYLAMRRRGLGSGLRGAAWSLLPIAAYLTGSIEMFWKMGVAIGDFAKGFVFSPRVWSGIALAGLAVVLFVVSGPLRRRRADRGRDSVGRGQGKAVAGSGRPRVARPGTTMTTTSGTSPTSCAATASPEPGTTRSWISCAGSALSEPMFQPPRPSARGFGVRSPSIPAEVNFCHTRTCSH
jgi:hypothetical protein